VSTTDERGNGTLETGRLVAADGDDIVVLHDVHPRRPGRRDVLIGVATVVLLIVAGGIAIVLVNRGSNAAKVRTTSSSVVTTPPVARSKPKPKVAAKPAVPVRTPSPTAAVIVPAAPATSPPIAVGNSNIAPPPTVAPAPTTLAPPKQYGPSALTWTAPRSMTIVAGTTAVLSVAAHNGTDGTVTLPHPLSCTPRLDHGEICAQVVQVLASRASAGAQYTIDAHDVVAGHYSLTIEGVLRVAVTVRARA
jgi:hypothetical protein